MENESLTTNQNTPKKSATQNMDMFFRGAYRTQLDLTALADNKANIMISVNGLIITAMIATKNSLTLNTTSFQYVLLFILLSCAISMTFAILAARPKITQTQASFKGLISGKDNVLYFNNFNAISEEEYCQVIEELTTNSRKVCKQMSAHIYNLGIILTRKYFFLKYSYYTFLFGIVLAAFAFILNSTVL